MKTIIRKRLAALLSFAGLASSTTGAAAQVLKGSDEGTKTKAESTIKSQKNTKENHAAVSQTAIKHKKSGKVEYPIEHGKEASLTTTKTDASSKQSKNVSEANAAKNATRVKTSKSSSSTSGKISHKGSSSKTGEVSSTPQQ